MMATIGYLLLQWGELERRMAGRALPPELAQVQQLRNTLCHGLRSAKADPSENDEPHICCRTLTGAEVRYSWLDLDAAIRMLERYNGSFA
jgi:hypothetical protein